MTTIALLRDQLCGRQFFEVERQRGCSRVKQRRQHAGRQPLRSGTYERAEQTKAQGMCQCSQRTDDVFSSIILL